MDVPGANTQGRYVLGLSSTNSGIDDVTSWTSYTEGAQSHTVTWSGGYAGAYLVIGGSTVSQSSWTIDNVTITIN
jgi:hypothetical protein